MERGGKKKRQGNEKRGPLQDLNGLPINKPDAEKSSNVSSCTAAVSCEAPKGCLRVLNSSKSSSSSSSLINHLDKKSRTFSKLANDEPKKSTANTPKALPRSEQNIIPKESLLLKSKRIQLQCLTQRQSCKNYAKPISENGQRPKLSSAQDNPLNKLKIGCEEFQAKMKNSLENKSGEPPAELLLVPNSGNLNRAENCTPVAKVTNECAVDSVNFTSHKFVTDDLIYEKANGNSGNAVKTPPLEASLSPEIQCPSHSKMLVLRSSATPVCYGAGHLFSGVTDKRKCRRRGSLNGLCNKTNLFDDVTNDSQDSSIPSIAQASIRWMLSPCEDSRNRLDQYGVVCNNAVGTYDSLPSPSTLICGYGSDLLCANNSYNGSGSVDNVASKRRSRNVSPRKDMDESVLAISSNATYNDNVIGDNSALSFGSLNSGSVIQTPHSDSSSVVCVGKSRLEVHGSNVVWSELDSITQTLTRVNLSVSPRCETSMWDAPGLGSHFGDMSSSPSYADITQIQKNAVSASSWVSDATLNNSALSQIRISWQDDLVSEIVETDELDCCCCLSDEGKETYPGGNNDQRTYPWFESGESKECDLSIDNDLHPILLDYEPCISGKEKPSLHRPNTCAESICTDHGAGLVASDDSGLDLWL